MQFVGKTILTVRPGHKPYKSDNKKNCESYLAGCEHFSVLWVKFILLPSMKKIVWLIFMLIALNGYSKTIADAYSALSIYDYFKAKALFFKSISKNPAEAAYGLSIIFYRTDNPFSNTDSAAKYISIAQKTFKDTVSYSGFSINKITINELADAISIKGFYKYNAINTIQSLNYYLKHYYFATDSLKTEAYSIRDGLALNYLSAFQSSDSLQLFMLTYPESNLFHQAKKLFYDYQYKEKVPDHTMDQLHYFISNFQENPNISNAEIKLFGLTAQLHSNDSLYAFIKKYSTTLTRESAWKALYSNYVKDYSQEELSGFLRAYPDYPYNDKILKEIELSNRILIPLEGTNEKTGYIDTLGNWVIAPVYDDALEFSEGFAAVCRNDSCFYINKEGQKTTDMVFDETENYQQGIAIVKKQSAYYLINRSAQFMSQAYQDISKSSDGLFVCKLNNLYGAINDKGEIIIPFTYNKLGNFKNGYAYYMTSHYGLVDLQNHTLKAQWEWISDVDTNGIAIVKKAGKFGLMTVSGSVILAAQFDYITSAPGPLYLVVKNGLYGFYNTKEHCYATALDYDYDAAFEADYYTNGRNFKLIQDDEVAIADANGRISINYGTYGNIYFAKNEIIRAQKNNRFGFLDRKLKAITAFEFDKATDFENDLAIVKKGNTAMLIDKTGKAVYTLKNGDITAFQEKLYQIELNGQYGLITGEGNVLLNAEFNELKFVYGNLIRCTKTDGMYLYNCHNNQLKKL